MDTLLPFLLKHHLLTHNEEYHLTNIIYSSSQKAQKLLNYLKTKGDGSLQKFLCCLNLAYEHIAHKEIVDKLKQKMQSNSFDCTDFCSHDCEQEYIRRQETVH